MDVRRSKRITTKKHDTIANTSKTTNKSIYFDSEDEFVTESEPSKTSLPRKPLKSSYFDPDFRAEDSDSSAGPVRKKKPKKQPPKSGRRKYELESDGSEQELAKKSKSLTEILQNKSGLNLSSDESEESSDEFEGPKRNVDLNGHGDGYEDKSSDVEASGKAEYFDFTSLVSRVREVNAEEQAQKVTPVESYTHADFNKDYPEDEQMEICELLAMGEDVSLSAKDIKRSVSKLKIEYEVPKQVEVVLESAPVKTKKKSNDLETALRRRLNSVRRENQLIVHKVHVLCWIAHGRYVNAMLNAADLLCIALSLLPSEKCYPPKRMNMEYLEDLISWFNKKVKLKKDSEENTVAADLEAQFQKLEAKSKTDLCLMFICVVRALGVKCRLVINLNVVPVKPPSDQLLPINLKPNEPVSSKRSGSDKVKIEKKSHQTSRSGKSSEKTPSKDTKRAMSSEKTASKDVKRESSGKTLSTDKKHESSRSSKSKNPSKKSVSDPKKESAYFKEGSKSSSCRRSKRTKNTQSDYFPKEKSGSSTKPKGKNEKKKNQEEDYLVEEMSTSEDDSEEEVFVSKKKKIDRRVLSSEEDTGVEEKASDTKNKSSKSNYWAEVFLEAEEKWVCVDIVKKSYHCMQQLYNGASHPVRYIIALNNDQSIKDVTKRYVPQFLSVTRKLRIDEAWWSSTLHSYKPSNTPQNREEDEELDRVLEEQPLPASISEYKNHPLYVLQRHLLKFQAIYPPDAPPVGFIKGEPVYSRLCVVQLHGREMWIKEAKVVKLGEKPYKVVKGRQKKDKFGVSETPRDLELFGLWQTEDYVPPVAQDGIVPRNAFGNVELFKPSMLPVGTVHLQLPGLQRIASKLNIDCAAAITGFDYTSCGWSYPVKDGFVVCEEYKDLLLDAYNQEVEEAEKREKEKREERIYANWKRLIKGLFIHEKLKRKYNFGGNAGSSSSSS